MVVLVVAVVVVVVVDIVVVAVVVVSVHVPSKTNRLVPPISPWTLQWRLMDSPAHSGPIVHDAVP